MAMIKHNLSTLPEGKTRLQIDLSSSAMEQLNWIMSVCELDTRKDLFNHAVSLLGWAAKEVASGRVIASLDKGSKHYTELSSPALSNASRHGERQRNIVPESVA